MATRTSDGSCRACGAAVLEPVLSLGEIPLVNAFREPLDSSPEQRYPLDVVRCPDCTLLQLAETVPPETLFREYAYFSSFADTFVEHARVFGRKSIERLGLDATSLVVEAASNDGYLLRHFRDAGVPVIGVAPARNVAAVARGHGIETIDEFLDMELAERIVRERGTADLVVANNVLAHVADPGSFVAALRTLAGDDGAVSVEVPYVCDLVDRLEFDTIYHEHVSYFSLTALTRLAEAHDLDVVHVERLSVHGGSLRVSLTTGAERDASVAEVLAQEQAWGIRDAGRYAAFADRVAAVKHDVRELVADLASRTSVAAYGAAAKGVVLANVCDLDAQLVAFAADRNPNKQGKLFPGVGIPVVPPEVLVREQPEYCLLFAWNLAEEILAQQGTYLARGGRFVVPVPVPKVVPA